jgi:hypothetical protein
MGATELSRLAAALLLLKAGFLALVGVWVRIEAPGEPARLAFVVAAGVAAVALALYRGDPRTAG